MSRVNAGSRMKILLAILIFLVAFCRIEASKEKSEIKIRLKISKNYKISKFSRENCVLLLVMDVLSLGRRKFWS